MNLAEAPIVYDSREAPYKLPNQGTNTAASLVRVPTPTFYPYRDGVGKTHLTASSLYPAEGIGDTGEVVVHSAMLEPLERARARVREAGFELAVVSGFSSPALAQRKFAEIYKRLLKLQREHKNKYPTTADEVRLGRLASSIGTPAILSTSAHPKKSHRIREGIRNEKFSGLISPPKHDVFNLAEELFMYRGNLRPFSDSFDTNICPVVIHTAEGDENFGRTVQCVLIDPKHPEIALNMGIGIDIPYPSLQEPKAFEDMDLNRLRFLVKDNPLAREYFIECEEPADEQTLENIIRRRRVLYNAMMNEGFVRGKRQGIFTLPAEPTDMPPRHHMLNQGRQFGHKW